MTQTLTRPKPSGFSVSCITVLALWVMLFFLGIIATVLVFNTWNDQLYDDGLAAMVEVPAHTINPAHEGKLVHVRGLATASTPIIDPEFQVRSHALVLHRRVSMYQWVEVKKEASGRNNHTSYTYHTEWLDYRINSDAFQQKDHKNPRRANISYASKKFIASAVTIGSFVLPNDLLDKLTPNTRLMLESPREVPSLLGPNAKISAGSFYVSDNPQDPQVGDIKIDFIEILPITLSVLAQQTGHTFQPYTTSHQQLIYWLEIGNLSAEQVLYAKTSMGQNRGMFMGCFLSVILLVFASITALVDPWLRYLNYVLSKRRQLLFVCFLTIALLSFTYAAVWLSFGFEQGIYMGGLGVLCLVLAAMSVVNYEQVELR